MQKRPASPKDIRLTVTVSEEVWLRLRELAFKQRRSLNDLLNEWIACHLADPQPDEGRKGGVTYPLGGSPAMICHDG
jgi:hypothetical protein